MLARRLGHRKVTNVTTRSSLLQNGGAKSDPQPQRAWGRLLSTASDHARRRAAIALVRLENLTGSSYVIILSPQLAKKVAARFDNNRKRELGFRSAVSTNSIASQT
jgi:hypothetical protein